MFNDCYHENPTSVNCYFPFQTADENFSAWVEEWGAGSLKWRGDGEKLVLWQKPDGSYSQEPKPQPANGGKEIGRLKIVIPELKRLAYVTALTSSINDIMEMSSVLEAYEAMRGDLRGIPFVLSRVPRMVSTPGADGKRVRREKWLWHLEAQPVWVQAQLSVMQRAALPTGTAQLESGAIADIETGEILDDDYEYEEPAETTRVVNDAPASGNGQSPNGNHIDARSWLEEKIKDDKTTLGMVVDAAAMSGLYTAAAHALNALKEYEFPAGFKLERKQGMTGKGALTVFDWLTARKEEPAAA